MTVDTLRTEADIVRVMQEPEEFFDFRDDTLVTFLTFAAAKPFLKEDATAEAWAEVARPLTREAVLAEMQHYLDFAWGKVRDHRGLSAARSVAHYRWWCWLLGDDDMVELAEKGDTGNYGAGFLRKVCEKYGFGHTLDRALSRMSDGLPCRPEGCDEGCGRGIGV